MAQAFNRRRKLHGVPPTVRGQFDHELRAPAATLAPQVNGIGGPQYVDGVLRRQPNDPTAEYDVVEYDPASRITRCLRDGAPHRTDGAAVTGFESDQLWRSYWLYGREVSQAAVWRKMAADPQEFDQLFSEGWSDAEYNFRSSMSSGFGDAAEYLKGMLELPPTDEDMREDPESAPYLLGQYEAAQRLQREWLLMLFDGEPTVPSLDEARDEMLEQARAA